MDNGESRNKFWKGVLVGAMVMAFVGLTVVGISAGIFLIGRTVIDNQAGPGQMVQAEEDHGSSAAVFNRIGAKMEYIQRIVEEYFLYEENMESIENGIYKGMMYGLKDPYAAYYNEEDFVALQEDTNGEYCGIGAMVQQNVSTGIITIVKIFKDSPAYDAGMLPGDILYLVEGESVTGKDLDLLVKEDIRGEEGTFVNVTVLRGDQAEQVELRIERRQVEVPTVEYQMLEDNVGYIYVMQFDLVTAGQFKLAVDDLESQGMEKLVIDVRDNPGGVLDTAVEMLAYILPEDKMNGMLIYTEDKDGKGERYFCADGQIQAESDYGYQMSGYPRKDGHELEIPIAVLANGNSASASELFSGALQDYEAAVIVGTQTFGKGIVQHLIPLGDGTAIKLTTSRYYIPSGVCIHEEGVTPDIEVELDDELKTKSVIELSEDNQLAAALKALEDMD